MSHPSHLEGPPPVRTRRSGGRRRTGLLAAAGIAALIATGCGSSHPSAAPTSTASTAAGATAVKGAEVQATLTEFHIALSRTQLTPGPYTFEVVNAGHTVHSLSITGPHTDATLSTDLQPGQHSQLVVTLQPGRYDVFCPVGDHKALGMNLELSVRA